MNRWTDHDPGRTLALLALAIAPLAVSCSLVRPTLVADRVEIVLPPNGVIETRSLWAGAKPLRVRVQPATGVGADRIVELRAVHDGTVLSILAIWNDLTDVGPRRVWAWDARSRQYYLRVSETDMLAFKFTLSGSPRACMMNGEVGVFDVWRWRSGWNDAFGYADDLTLTVSRTPLDYDGVRVYPMPGGPLRGGENNLYLRWEEDDGRNPYRLRDKPNRFEGPIVLGLEARPPTRGAGDVRVASGRQSKASWMVEIARRLETDDADDYQFEGRGPHVFSLAIADNDGGPAHLTSPLIYLYLD